MKLFGSLKLWARKPAAMESPAVVAEAARVAYCQAVVDGGTRGIEQGMLVLGVNAVQMLLDVEVHLPGEQPQDVQLVLR